MIGLVYAGGKSSRFGKDKATYRVPGLPATNVQLAVEKLTPFCQQIVICANEINQAHIVKLVGQVPAVQIICDIPPYDCHGPLSAIIACTNQFSIVQDYLTLAVDYPYITKNSLAVLARTPNSYIATSQHNHYSFWYFMLKCINHILAPFECFCTMRSRYTYEYRDISKRQFASPVSDNNATSLFFNRCCNFF